MRTGHIIIAGPGTGKTTELVRRVIEFLSTSSQDEKCIVSTFTRKAAEELSERISAAAPTNLATHNRVLVGTIHSIASTLLKTFGNGKFDDREILSEELQIPFIHSKLINLGFGENEVKGRAGWNLARECAAIYNKITDQRLTLNELQSVPNIQRFIDSYPVYLELLKFEKSFDFATLQSVLLAELQNNDEMLGRVVGEYGKLFVDEYQDVNDLQADIFVKLMDAGADLVVVGDDDQSIYGFRGSRVQNMLEFPQYCSDLNIPCTSSSLDINYRSTINLVASFNSYLEKVPYQRFAKNLTSSRKDSGSLPTYVELADEIEEANFIANKIKQLKELGLIESFGQVAILCSSVRNHGSAIQQELKNIGIPVLVSGNGGLFETDFGIEMRLLVSFWLDKDDAIENLKTSINDQLGSVYLSMYEKNGYLQKLESLKTKHKYLASCTALCYELFERTEFIDRHSHHEQNLGTITSLVLSFDRFAGRFDPYGLQAYFSYLADTATIDYEIPQSVNGVVLTTIHRAKGLEFDVVFVASQNNRGAPPPTVVNHLDTALGFGDDEIAHEKFRAFYVAITRARNLLFLTSTEHLTSTARRYTAAQPLEKFCSTGMVLPAIKVDQLVDMEQSTHTERSGLSNPLSYNSIRTYEICPKQYWYANVLRLETVRIGGMTFGSNMHRVVELILRRFAQNGRVIQKEVDEIFRDIWRDDPYRSPAENAKYFQAGQKQINQFKSKFVENLNPSDTFEVESVFNVEMQGVAITGRFDMVRESGGVHEIVDFKTGDEGDYANQLTLYAACRKIQVGVDVKKLSIYYLKTGKTVEVDPVSPEVWQAAVIRVRDGIESRDYSATPGKHCGDCSYRMICTDAR